MRQPTLHAKAQTCSPRIVNDSEIIALLEENRQLRIELDRAHAGLATLRGGVKTPAATLPLRLTVGEFARLVRCCDETIRRMIHAREIEAKGQPFLIPRRELEKFGVSLADAAQHYAETPKQVE